MIALREFPKVLRVPFDVLFSRRDIEPYSFIFTVGELDLAYDQKSIIHLTTIHAYGTAFACAVAYGIMRLLDTHLLSTYSSDPSSWSTTDTVKKLNGSLSMVLAMPFIVSPLFDIGATAFCMLHRLIKPQWFKAPGPFKDSEYTSVRRISCQCSELGERDG
ncbi:hypothetical protein QBC34DRAFT_463698 [Podospora aff. communis PSN243]|uniref:Uncharacterized protein n=1 Tax=Podospora aff. communis PSN243 TaxID=3040156 RepID=A0AAV9GMA5_9PEZI|nr:hypothetical protein QBC34DRAFT_463698 [Podospora aff. communis PSN243]